MNGMGRVLRACAWLAAAAAPLNASALAARAQEPIRVYFGTYTQGTPSKGIYVATFDPATGRLGEPALAAEAINPSFLALHPNREVIYAVNEVAELDGAHEGGVSAFRIEDAGRLNLINRAGSKGTAPCHLAVAPGGAGAIVANYGSGTISVFEIEPNSALKPLGVVFEGEPGSGVNKARQEGPHAHCVRFDPRGQIVLAADLGADRVYALKFQPDNTRALLQMTSASKTPPGGGPRHLGYHPAGAFVFVNNELTSSLTSYRLDSATGALEEIATASTLPEGDHPGNSTAETVVHPSGKFVYVSNRGHNSIAIFAIDQETGKLTPLGHQSTQGKTPRNFNIDPTGKWLLAANQESNSVVVFAIDAETGKLTPTGQAIEVPAPVCVIFARAH